MKVKSVRASIAFLFLVSAAVVGLGGGAGAQSDEPARVDLYKQNFTMQNYFFDGEQQFPFFDEQSGQINQGVEIRQSDGYIYSFNFTRSNIIMRWNTSPDFDMFEPYVAALIGLTPEQAAAAGLQDQYVITFEEPISHYEIMANENMPLVPEVRVIDDYTLLIAITGGTPIGDGVNASIAFRPVS